MNLLICSFLQHIQNSSRTAFFPTTIKNQFAIPGSSWFCCCCFAVLSIFRLRVDSPSVVKDLLGFFFSSQSSCYSLKYSWFICCCLYSILEVFAFNLVNFIFEHIKHKQVSKTQNYTKRYN